VYDGILEVLLKYQYAPATTKAATAIETNIDESIIYKMDL
jgi:hypothetical protein